MSIWYRRIKTRQERTANQRELYDELVREYPLKPYRCRRGSNRLPNSWDDLNPQGVTIKNWKRYRRTRYKPLPPVKEKRSSKKYAEHMARKDHSHLFYRRHWWLWLLSKL